MSTEDVVTIVKIATECRMPMVVYSGATSLGESTIHVNMATFILNLH